MNINPVPIKDILADIFGARGLIGVPPEIALDAVRKTAIDFCQQTSIWEYEAGFKTQYNVRDYPIRVPDGTRLASMKWVEFNGNRLTPRTGTNQTFCGYGYSFVMQGKDTLWVSPTPVDTTCSDYVAYGAALKPSQNACEIPDFLIEDYNDALTSGAAYRLFQIPKQDWSNAALAMVNAREYSRLIARARLQKMQNFSQGGVEMTGGYF